MKILLSIQPKFVKQIQTGKKRFEFRKRIPASLSAFLIYASSPMKKLIGYVETEKIIKDSPDHLWKICQKEAGIEEVDFFKYFQGKEVGYAIEISHLVLFKHEIVPNKVFEKFNAPQNYLILSDSKFSEIIREGIRD